MEFDASGCICMISEVLNEWKVVREMEFWLSGIAERSRQHLTSSRASCINNIDSAIYCLNILAIMISTRIDTILTQFGNSSPP